MLPPLQVLRLDRRLYPCRAAAGSPSARSPRAPASAAPPPAAMRPGWSNAAAPTGRPAYPGPQASRAPSPDPDTVLRPLPPAARRALPVRRLDTRLEFPPTLRDHDPRHPGGLRHPLRPAPVQRPRLGRLPKPPRALVQHWPQTRNFARNRLTGSVDHDPGATARRRSERSSPVWRGATVRRRVSTRCARTRDVKGLWEAGRGLWHRSSHTW